MGLSTPMALCLSADLDATISPYVISSIEGFWDPIAEANMAIVSPILDACCVLISLDADLALEIPSFFAEISFDIPEIVAALNLPIFNLDFDIDVSLPPLIIDFLIGIITIPVNIVLNWFIDFPNIEMPTIDMIIELLLELNIEMPDLSLQCIAEFMMLPFDAVAAALELALGATPDTPTAEIAIDAGICKGSGDDIDTGVLLTWP